MHSPLPALALLLAASPASADIPLESTVPGLAITALDSLPQAPAARGDAADCQHLLAVSTKTPAGRAVAAKGWGVTAEAPLGPLTAVSFVGGYERGTSGACVLTGGNVGLFDGDRLLAVVYATKADDVLAGHIARLEGGTLRLWSGDFLPYPVADLLPSPGGGVSVRPLPPQDSVCGDSAMVPVVYGQPIDRARDRLIAAGWAPLAPDPANIPRSGLAAEIAALGLPEVEDCSGTGMAFCSYAYSGPAGTLSLFTAGEVSAEGSLPMVTDYAVSCR